VTARRAKTNLAMAAGFYSMITLVAAAAWADTPVSVSVSDSVIRITPRYQGELVRVMGTAPEECAVAVKLSSARKEVHYSCKRKVGPLWLSVGQVYFTNVPLMYKMKSTGPLDDLLSAADQVKYVLGREGLKASMKVSSRVDRDVYLNEMILIRERIRFFSFGEGSVQRHGRSFSTTFFWPPDGPPGRYHVEAFAIRQGQIVGTAETQVQVELVGFEAWVRSLATKHGIIYGMLAVIIAIASGLLVSMGFRSSGRHGAKAAARF
jgi:uncharacterized protein (TIGR02186 family)